MSKVDKIRVVQIPIQATLPSQNHVAQRFLGFALYTLCLFGQDVLNVDVVETRTL